MQTISLQPIKVVGKQIFTDKIGYYVYLNSMYSN